MYTNVNRIIYATDDGFFLYKKPLYTFFTFLISVSMMPSSVLFCNSVKF